MSERKPRRRRRFGRIYSRKWASGRRTWAAQYFCKVEDRRVTRNFDTKREAGEFLDELERRMVAEAERETVEAARPAPAFVDYAEQLIDSRLAATLSPGTVGLYRANLRALRGFYGSRRGRAAVRLDKITASSFLDYRAWRKGHRNSSHGTARTVSAATVNRDQQFACRVLGEAVIDGHVASNPLAGLRKLREPRRPRRYLSKAEVRRLMLAAPAHFRPLVVAAVFTGCRKSELLRLRWSDVDFEQGKIAVFRPKTGTSDWLDLHAHLAAELRGMRASRNAPRPGDHIFLNSRGGPWRDIRKVWASTLTGAGLAEREGAGFHCLRHTFATHYLTNGGAATDLRAQLGHADLTTTQRYADLVSERRRDAVMAMSFDAKDAGSVPRGRRGRESA